MSFVYKDRVGQLSATTGTGTYSLSSAIAGFQGFDEIGTGNQTHYVARMGEVWEVGLGTLTVGSPSTLSRDVILDSSTGAAINWEGGNKSIFCTQPAAAIVSYPRTAAEIAAGVTPTDYGYEPGNVKRYGAVGDGVTDDTAAFQTAWDALLPYQDVLVPGGGEYLLASPLVLDSNGALGVNGMVGVGGTPRILMTTTGVGITIRGVHGGGSGTLWFWRLQDLYFVSATAATILKVGEGDTWHGVVRRCWFNGTSAPTRQLVCLTNTNALAFRDYYCLFERCVFRGGDYSFVIGGDWSSGSFVEALQAVNRVKMTDCDFYGHRIYGLYITDNGHTIKGVHFDVASGAIADIYLENTEHYIEAFHESGADHAVHFESESVGGRLILSNTGMGERVSMFRIGVTVYESATLPFLPAMSALILDTRTSVGRFLVAPRILAQDIYGVDGDQAVNVRSGASNRLTVQHYDKATNASTTEYLFTSAAIQATSALDDTRNLGSTTARWLNTYTNRVRPGAGVAIWTSGEGTPEGAVVAVIGSMFTRTDGSTGTTLYIKESGAGNTGWVAK